MILILADTHIDWTSKIPDIEYTMSHVYNFK